MIDAKEDLPPNVTRWQNRHGKWLLRFRKKGYPVHYFKARLGTPAFRKELAACYAVPLAEDAVEKRHGPGTIAALVVTYYGLPVFKDLAASSRYTYSKQLERFVKDFGHLKVKRLTRQHVGEIIGDMSDTPSAANNLLDRLKVLMQVALNLGWRSDDPTYKLKGFREKGDGFHTWTEPEIEKFKDKHPAGSRPRRALMLLLHTSQRKGDLITMGEGHRADGRIKYRQEKTGVWLSVPEHPDLAAELDLAPKGDPAYLITEFGNPFTRAGFGNWFRSQCDAAGLKHCSAHGLRKAAARRLAEAGCTHAEIKAVTGHRTDKEVTRYIEAANQKRLADHAVTKQRAAEAVDNRKETVG